MAAGRQGHGTARTPVQQALALLTRREHSRSELTRKLHARGYSVDDIDQALARLIEDGWQSDARFAEALVRHRAASGYGPCWIRAELATHRLDDAMIESALAAFDGNWHEHARSLLARRGLTRPEDGSAWPFAQKCKAMDVLLRRGFEPAMMDAAMGADSSA